MPTTPLFLGVLAVLTLLLVAAILAAVLAHLWLTRVLLQSHRQLHSQLTVLASIDLGYLLDAVARVEGAVRELRLRGRGDELNLP